MEEHTRVERQQAVATRRSELCVVMDVREITKVLPLGREQIDILKGISFTIASGEILSIVGPSGSGKSTLLGIIAGLAACRRKAGIPTN